MHLVFYMVTKTGIDIIIGIPHQSMDNVYVLLETRCYLPLFNFRQKIALS